MKKFLAEFKEFIMKGNVLDLAVGVIIAGAFGTIINSLVQDVIMPPIGLALGSVDFNDLFIQLNKAAVSIPAGTTLAAAKEQGAVVIAYGSFLMTIINFLIIAFVVFMLVKAVNRIKDSAIKKGEPVADAPSGPTEIEVLMQIRDSLAK